MNSRTIKTLLGPVLCALAYFLLPKSIFAEPGARLAIGTVVWMAFWWITAPVEYAVTAFLPIGLNALFGMTEMQADFLVHIVSIFILYTSKCRGLCYNNTYSSFHA